MEKLERTAERRDFSNSHLQRISWPAIFGGTVIAIAAMTVLWTVGVAVKAMSVGPGKEGLGIAARVWWIGCGMISLFLGGLAAGRLAGLSRRWEGPLHGIITWGLATIAAFLWTTAVVAHFAPQDRRWTRSHHLEMPAEMSAFHQQSNLPEAILRDVRREGFAVLRRSAQAKSLKPSSGEENLLDTLVVATDELDAALHELYQGVKADANPTKSSGVVDVLVMRTGLSRPEARDRVARWTHLLNNAWNSTMKAKLRARLTRKHEVRATRVHMDLSGTAWFAAAYLLLSAVAGGLGGLLGAPRPRLRARVEPAETPQPPAPSAG